jgi:hypothetical protein
MFIGGFHKYREHCANAVRNGYADFVFQHLEPRTMEGNDGNYVYTVPL